MRMPKASLSERAEWPTARNSMTLHLFRLEVIDELDNYSVDMDLVQVVCIKILYTHKLDWIPICWFLFKGYINDMNTCIYTLMDWASCCKSLVSNSDCPNLSYYCVQGSVLEQLPALRSQCWFFCWGWQADTNVLICCMCDQFFFNITVGHHWLTSIQNLF